MFNENQLYSIPQFLRANFHQINDNELAFTTIRRKKWILDTSITFPTEYQQKKYKHLQLKLTNDLFQLQCDLPNFIFSLKCRQRKVDLNAGEKPLVFVTKQHRKFHLYAQLSYAKISYLRKNTHLRKDAAFLHFQFEGKFKKYDISEKRKHTKTNKNMMFSVLFTNFPKTKILVFMQ